MNFITLHLIYRDQSKKVPDYKKSIYFFIFAIFDIEKTE